MFIYQTDFYLCSNISPNLRPQSGIDLKGDSYNLNIFIQSNVDINMDRNSIIQS